MISVFEKKNYSKIENSIFKKIFANSTKFSENKEFDIIHIKEIRKILIQ